MTPPRKKRMLMERGHMIIKELEKLDHILQASSRQKWSSSTITPKLVASSMTTLTLPSFSLTNDNTQISCEIDGLCVEDGLARLGTFKVLVKKLQLKVSRRGRCHYQKHYERSLFLHFKNIFKDIRNIFIFLFFKWFWYFDIKNNFLKIKKLF